MRERAEAHGDTVYTKSHIQKHGDGNRWNESLRLSQTLPLSPARAHTLLSCSLAYTHTHAHKVQRFALNTMVNAEKATEGAHTGLAGGPITS